MDYELSPKEWRRLRRGTFLTVWDATSSRATFWARRRSIWRAAPATPSFEPRIRPDFTGVDSRGRLPRSPMSRLRLRNDQPGCRRGHPAARSRYPARRRLSFISDHPQEPSPLVYFLFGLYAFR